MPTQRLGSPAGSGLICGWHGAARARCNPKQQLAASATLMCKHVPDGRRDASMHFQNASTPRASLHFSCANGRRAGPNPAAPAAGPAAGVGTDRAPRGRLRLGLAQPYSAALAACRNRQGGRGATGGERVRRRGREPRCRRRRRRRRGGRAAARRGRGSSSSAAVLGRVPGGSLQECHGGGGAAPHGARLPHGAGACWLVRGVEGGGAEGGRSRTWRAGHAPRRPACMRTWQRPACRARNAHAGARRRCPAAALGPAAANRRPTASAPTHAARALPRPPLTRSATASLWASR